MTRIRPATRFLLLFVLAGPCLVRAGSVSAQGRVGDSASSLQAAIEEVRRTPFHASPGSPWIKLREHRERRGAGLAGRDEGRIAALFVRRATQSEASKIDHPSVKGGNIFFFSLPIAAVLDVLVLAEVGDEGFSLDPLVSAGALAAPALVARLMGARTAFALAGSAIGFGSGALFAKAFDKFGIFLAPVLHAGATAMLSALGDRTRSP